MRFAKFLSESGSFESLNIQPEDFLKTIQKDCAKFFQEIFPCMLFRGMDASNAIVGYGTPRTDRKPKDTPQELHNMADEWFLKRFGWRCRSQGLFVSTKPYVGLYGDKYVIFPMGDYKYVFSPNIHDLMNDLDNAVLMHTTEKGTIKQNFDSLFPEQYPALQKTVNETLDEAEFTDKGLREYMQGKGSDRFSPTRTDREVMLNCKGYYFARLESPFERKLMSLMKVHY